MIYAVNRLTKEHRVVEERYSGGMRLPCRNPNLGKGWDYIQADADGWIEWKGGECPLPDDCSYKTKHKSGSFFNGSMPQTFGAHWRGLSDPVVAYRPIFDQPASEEPSGWDGVGLPPVGSKVEARRNDNDWLQVEVVAHDDGGIIYRDPSTADHAYKWAIGGGIRPIPTPRERWVEKALSLDCDPCAGMLSRKDFCGELYDALASGELPTPEKTQ
tara:strand:- start:375 stop:1019 length:645 start_codon:yes stop_codon:yes gene_type:complete